MPRVFLAHNWGASQLVHQRVKRVANFLRQHNVDVWFDETHMKGNMLEAMTRGIDACDVFVVFVTNEYLQKVESGNAKDNVRREFMYAAQTHPEKMLAVRFDQSLPSAWRGPVGMQLGAQLYVELSGEPPSEHEMMALLNAIRRHSPRAMWHDAVKRVQKVQKTMATQTTDGNLRTRVHSAAKRLGREYANKHLGAVLDELMLTLFPTSDSCDLPFTDKLRAVEAQIA